MVEVIIFILSLLLIGSFSSRLTKDIPFFEMPFVSWTIRYILAIGISIAFNIAMLKKKKDE